MSAGGFLEKLLDGADVEWMPLSRLAHINDGTHQTPKYTDAGVPFVSVQNISDLSGAEKFISESDFRKFRHKPRKGDLFMTRIGDVGTCAAVDNDDPLAYYVTLALIRVDRNKTTANYLKHFIESSFGKSELYQRTLIYAVPIKINLGEIGQIAVPIPCPDDRERSLAIQGEIVRILDTFTQLTAELTAELSQRKKQYNHYRDGLLTFDDDEVEWKTLGDVAEFRRGTAITKRQTTEGEIPVVANGPTSTYSHSQHNRDGETVVVARSGAYAGYVSYWNQPIFLTDAFSVHPEPNLLLPKFVFYLLQNKQSQLHDMKKGAGVPHVRVKEVEQYGVPVPSLAEQARIVAILDKFDILTTSLTEGLPREIELREKQYAYYRDLLLSFPKPDEVEA
ncbi:MAG: restriction endonuclease subunit S [Alphaproteobacteria bacterium]|nr:restriction endonuclease subunit S [Alphaproteobacteria bacterium]